jgi:hypothetical protein
MKILYVTGDSDYSALMFDKSGIDNNNALEELWEEANRQPNKELEVRIPKEDEIVYITAYEFGEVDSKFISFIQNKFMDYDDLKHHNYYIIY